MRFVEGQVWECAAHGTRYTVVKAMGNGETATIKGPEGIPENWTIAGWLRCGYKLAEEKTS